MIRFGSVCSGIEAASVAWQPLGWEAAWVSEIEPFPAAVLAHHYPDVPNLGDMRALPAKVLAGEVEAPDLLCGGTPCQAFSVAGLRRSLDDTRGNLTLTFVELANAIDAVRSERGERPAVIFWENVPGVLNTADNAFGCLLGGLAGESGALEPPGGRWSNAGGVLGPARAVAWRILDAQYFGLAQRRKRLFLVASARSGFDPAAVLFELEGSRRDSAPSRGEGQGSTGGAADGAGDSGQPYKVANCLTARMHKGINTTLDEGQTPVVCAAPAAVFVRGTNPRSADEAPTFKPTELAACLNGWDERHNPPKHLVSPPSLFGVRRLTPRECERLQGFPDDYTAIPWRGKTAADCPDGPRYKALGNSWAVPVVRWIGSRIAAALEAAP